MKNAPTLAIISSDDNFSRVERHEGKPLGHLRAEDEASMREISRCLSKAISSVSDLYDEETSDLVEIGDAARYGDDLHPLFRVDMACLHNDLITSETIIAIHSTISDCRVDLVVSFHAAYDISLWLWISRRVVTIFSSDPGYAETILSQLRHGFEAVTNESHSPRV
jgi:hypothetical protein